MLEFISTISNEFGWGMVGFALALTIIMFIEIGKIIYKAIKIRLEDEREEEENV